MPVALRSYLGGGKSTNGTLTFSITTVANDTLIVMGVNESTLSGATYDGVALTQGFYADHANDAAFYYANGVSAKTANVVISGSNGYSMMGAAWAVTGAAPVGDWTNDTNYNASGDGQSSNTTLTISTPPDSSDCISFFGVIHDYNGGDGGVTFNAGTLNVSPGTGDDISGFGLGVQTTNSAYFTWTATGYATYTHAGICVNPGAAGGSYAFIVGWSRKFERQYEKLRSGLYVPKYPEIDPKRLRMLPI